MSNATVFDKNQVKWQRQKLLGKLPRYLNYFAFAKLARTLPELRLSQERLSFRRKQSHPMHDHLDEIVTNMTCCLLNDFIVPQRGGRRGGGSC